MFDPKTTEIPEGGDSCRSKEDDDKTIYCQETHPAYISFEKGWFFETQSHNHFK